MLRVELNNDLIATIDYCELENFTTMSREF